MRNELKEPRLAKPGAGLPFFEWVVAKYIIMPARFKNVNQQTAIEDYVRESALIQKLVDGLSVESISERRLIPRLRGLEDSSRFWSVSMTLEHLIIVIRQMQSTIIELSEGRKIDHITTIAEVKPTGGLQSSDIRSEFARVTSSFVAAMENLNLEKHPAVTHAHPWFGELNAKEWLSFAAPHQSIHRKQIEEIIRRL